MKKYILPLFLSLVCACGQKTDESFPEPVFEEHFQDSTLRLDYVFCGDAYHQAIYLQGMHKTGPWAGRQKNLDRLPLKGNGQLYVKDPATGATLYAHSFSTLFQEWVGYPEARRVQKAFENSFQVPFPKDSVRIESTLCDNRGKESARLSHIVDPADILIRQAQDNGARCEVISQGGSLPEAIDVVILSEGYTSAQEEKFWADARRAPAAFTAHEPFAGRSDAFTFRAVFLPSKDSGPSIPRSGDWHTTLADSHFDTFYSER